MTMASPADMKFAQANTGGQATFGVPVGVPSSKALIASVRLPDASVCIQTGASGVRVTGPAWLTTYRVPDDHSLTGWFARTAPFSSRMLSVTR